MQHLVAPMQILVKNQNLFHTFPEFNDALEVLFVLEGMKPAARQMIHEQDVHRAVAFCEANGLHWEVSSFKIIKDNELLVVPEYPQEGHYFLYLSRDEDVCRLAKFYEASRNDEQLGKILGYPPCCVQFYLDNHQKASLLRDDYSLLSIANTSTETAPSFVTNNLARFFSVSLISHFPCSYTCAATELIGKAHFAIVSKYNVQLAAYIRDVLQGPVISSADTGIHLLKGCTYEGNMVRYREPWMTSPNEFHATLQLCDNVKILDKNHIQLCQDSHVVEDVAGEHIGVVVFG